MKIKACPHCGGDLSESKAMVQGDFRTNAITNWNGLMTLVLKRARTRLREELGYGIKEDKSIIKETTKNKSK
jgi:hypothetical protein